MNRWPTDDGVRPSRRVASTTQPMLSAVLARCLRRRGEPVSRPTPGTLLGCRRSPSTIGRPRRFRSDRFSGDGPLDVGERCVRSVNKIIDFSDLTPTPDSCMEIPVSNVVPVALCFIASCFYCGEFTPICSDQLSLLPLGGSINQVVEIL